MALIPPVLDNRTYQQLRDELVGRIPVYAPEWTDHNESDPGIALLELFAHLGESLLYRFNQIPETTKIEFLRLLGVRPRPAQTATALVAAKTDLRDGVQVLGGTEAAAGSVLFEADDEVYVWPLDAVAAGKTPDPTVFATPLQIESRDDALARVTLLPDEQPGFYTTTVVSADPLAPDAVTLDVDRQLDRSLWIAILSKPTTDRTLLAGQTLFVGIAFDDTVRPPFTPGPTVPTNASRFDADLLTRDPPPVSWRLWNGAGGTPAFSTLSVLHDTTRGLLTSGVVKVVLPATLPADAGETDGVRDAPPPLADTELAARVIGWLQVFRPGSDPSLLSSDIIPPVRWVGLNAVGVTQARTATPELLGSGTGDEDQSFELAHRPVLAGSARVEVEGPDGWEPWTEVESFVASGPEDRHVLVDPIAGLVSFGGARVPQIGERIRVAGYRYGGGTAGNLPAGAITTFSGVGGVDVTQPLPADGGADAAELSEALDEVPAIVHRHDRAVVATDFEELAREVAGVARADTLARMHPDSPTVEAAGVVSVVVFGPGDAQTVAAPQPDLGLLRRVARHLNARRLVTTELYVIPPEYVQITLSVGVQVRPGYQADAVRRWVSQLLRQYLAALPTGGPDGAGWPLGRDVRRAELEAVAVQTEGVEYLQELLLGEVATDAAGNPVAVPADLVVLDKWQVPTITSLTVTVGNPLPLGTPEQPQPPSGGVVGVPIPVEVC